MHKNTLIGVLIVTWCVLGGTLFGTNCQVTKNMTPDLKCIRRCVKKGSKYGLWSGNKVYVLEPQANASQFAGKNVKVTGTLSGDTIRIAALVVEAPADNKP